MEPAVDVPPIHLFTFTPLTIQESMHPPLPDLFLAEIFANIEQLLIFNRHVVTEFSEIHRTTKARHGRLGICKVKAGCVDRLIYRLTSSLATDHAHTQAFGAFFKKAAPFFKMYSAYVSNYDRAMETLIHLIEVRGPIRPLLPFVYHD